MNIITRMKLREINESIEDIQRRSNQQRTLDSLFAEIGELCLKNNIKIVIEKMIITKRKSDDGGVLVKNIIKEGNTYSGPEIRGGNDDNKKT